MRLIDADALNLSMMSISPGETKEYCYPCREILKEIDDAPTIEPEQRWIPCSERLPDKEVLCCDTRGEMIIGYPYQDDESNTGYSAVLDDVYMIDCIAWMEKPEPYREKQ